VSKVPLDGAGVLTLSGEVEAGGMPQHVGVYGEREPGEQPSPRHDLPHRRRRERPLPFRSEEVRRVGVVAAQLPKRPNFRTAKGVYTGRSVLYAVHVNRPGVEVYRIPPERHQLPDPQPVTVRQHDERLISSTMPSRLPRRFKHLVDFGRREVFPAPY